MAHVIATGPNLATQPNDTPGDAHWSDDGIAALSPDRIMQLCFAFRASKVLLSAVELDLFTELASGPLGMETLRERLGLHRRGARDFLDALVALGMLQRQGEFYLNTPEADFYLDRNIPYYVGGVLHLANNQLYPDWGRLTEALRTGKPQNGTTDGAEAFDTFSSNPGMATGFAQGMTGASLPAARALARRFPWKDYRSFVDVGTAEGAVPVELARAHPHLSGAGFDLPALRRVFETYVERHRLTDRVRFHAGDFFDGPLPSADVLVLGQILHDWGLEAKRELLAKAFAALPERGALVVYDQMIDDERRHVPGLLTSLTMLLETQNGFDYGTAECTTWMRDVGFSAIRHEPLSGPFSMMVGIK